MTTLDTNVTAKPSRATWGGRTVPTAIGGPWEGDACMGTKEGLMVPAWLRGGPEKYRREGAPARRYHLRRGLEELASPFREVTHEPA
jgi:hypothetical protein